MPTHKRRYPKEEFARRGDEIYERVVRPNLEPRHQNKFVAIDIETGAYEINANEMAACDRLYARGPEAQPWLAKVGSLAEHNLEAVPAHRFLSPRIVRRSTDG